MSDDEVLTCAQCGVKYTMAEFRVWCYQHYSALCIDCDVKRMKQLMHDKYGVYYPVLEGKEVKK
jgi:hypothetical protein